MPEDTPETENEREQRIKRVLAQRETFARRLADVMTEHDVNEGDVRQGTMQAMMRTVCVIAAEYGLSPFRLISTFVAEAESAYDNHTRQQVGELLSKLVLAATEESGPTH